ADQIDSNQAFIAHVGDSRAYLLRRGELVSLTSDESLLPDLVRSGSGQTTAFRRGKLRPLLTRALGIETAQAVPPKITHYTLQAHDAMLLCTDGAYRGVALADLQAAVLQKERPEWISDRVVALGRMAGSNDNATAIFARDATLHGAPAEAPAHRQRPRRSFVALTAAVALFWAATLGLMAMWGGSSRLYLGTDGAGAVTLYAGEPASVLGVPLHLARQTYGISQADLPQAIRRELADGVPVGSAEVADSVVAKWQAHRRR
ncbi:MAG: hypothetical protein GIW99_09135, partial [Candidatus Eremiobacteraeota bacterium]|nr:hypothetical protein [Candidatus Eremiobacteraeota bacterium]